MIFRFRYPPMVTYEESQPWITYVYGLTHDKLWPFWTSTRFLGKAKIICTCRICGDSTVMTMKIPRFGAVPEPVGGKHLYRTTYLEAHAHGRV